MRRKRVKGFTKIFKIVMRQCSMLRGAPLADLGKIIERIISKVKKEEELAEEAPVDIPATSASSAPFPVSASIPDKKIPETVYIKASTLHSLDELNGIKDEVESGNIIIVKVGPLARKSVDDVKRAVSELSEFAENIGGDIARLGEERVVVTPFFVKIWREKMPKEEDESSSEAE